MFPSLNKALLLAATLGLSTLAQAHVGTDLADHHALGLVDGFLHPFTGLDHLAAMLAVGFWSALSTRRVWLAPMAFANMLLVGAVMGLSGIAVFHGMAHGVEFSAASPVAALAGMVAGTAVLHGLGLAAGLALRSRSVWWPRLAGAALALWGAVLLAQLA